MFKHWFAPKLKVKPLKILAEGLDDLALLSAVLQDAVMRPSEMVFDQKSRTFTIILNRYCHELASTHPLRARAALKFHGVAKVASKRLDNQEVLDLLILKAEALEPPGFAIELVFAGKEGAGLRFEVECLDILLVDLTPPRRSQHRPNHA